MRARSAVQVSALPAIASSAEPALEETRRTLLGIVHRRFGAVPESVIVEHVVRWTEGADFVVRKAALEALLRRRAFALRDSLRVTARPARSAVLGEYSTSRPSDSKGRRASGRGLEPRPYQTELQSLAPLVGSCSCPDFTRSSLGLCKHLLVVLGDVYASRKRVEMALGAKRKGRPGPRLDWDPGLPLLGELDRSRGLVWTEGARGITAGRAGVRDALAKIRSALVGDRFAAGWLARPERRLELLRSLERVVSTIEVAPAARAVVAEELERAERRALCRKTAGAAERALRTLGRKLYPYQLEGVRRFLSEGRLLLADDMGLGKTMQAIACCHALFHAGRVRRGLVIVPASLKPQWLREWRQTTNVPAEIVDGSPAERAARYASREPGFLILNYEQLLRDLEAIRAIEPELVVLDEAQRIKNYATKTATYVKRLAPTYRLVLTGTPFENHLEELASVLDWVDDVALAPKWRLVPWYTQWDGDGGGGKVGARHLDTLRARMATPVLRRVRKEVLSQLPKRTDTRVPVDLTPQQQDEHDALVRPIAALVRTARRRPLTQAEFLQLMSLLTKQRMICNGLGQLRFDELWPTLVRSEPEPALLEGLFAPKLFELRRLAGELVGDQGRKVIIFSQWRNMLRLAEWSLRDVLSSRGLRAVFFTGAEKTPQRTRAIVDFHDEPDVAVMFLSDAGGVGLNLQRAASACINLELPWNPAVLEQRIGRIYRLGQQRPIDVYNLVSEQGIESRIAGLVAAKQALFSGLFDGQSDAVRFDAAGSFLSRIQQLVEPSPVLEATEGPEEAELDDDDQDLGSTEDAEMAEAELPDEIDGAVSKRSARNGQRGEPSPEGPPSGVRQHPTAQLFAQLSVERTKSGGVRIEAPKEAAASLLALFDGMAKLMSGVVNDR